MKKTCLALLTLCALLTARADITTGLVGYWSLASGPGFSTVADLTTNGNTGTLLNFGDPTYNNMWTTASDPNNRWPYALIFNQGGTSSFGTNTCISIANSPSLELPSTNKQWTLSAWVNLSVTAASEPANAGIICKGNLGLEQYALYMSGGKFTTIFRNAAGTGNETVSTTDSPSPNTWYHVVATVLEPKGSAQAEAMIYVNGVLDSGANANTYTTVYLATNTVFIGCRPNASGVLNSPFEGTIDEVRIYDRALTASDVAQLYANQAFTGVLNNGVGWWNGLAATGSSATLDTTSANFSTNTYTGPLGTAVNLASLLSFESANSIANSCVFGDSYYSNKSAIPVTATNLTIAPGGVTIGNASGAGTVTFANSLLAYTLASSDGVGLKDGVNPTALVQSGGGTTILTGTNSFSGGTTVSGGTLQLGNGFVSGHELGTSSSVTVGGTLAFDGTNNVVFNDTISGSGYVTQEGTGSLTLGGNNSYSGGTTLNGGSLIVASMNDSSGSIGTGPVNLGGAGEAIVYTGTGDTTVRQINGSSGSTNSIDVPNGVTLEIDGRVTGSAAWALNKLDTGTLILGGSADNSFLGMTVSAGTLILNKAGGTGHAIGNPLVVNNGAMVQFANTGYFFEIYSNASAPVTINSGGAMDIDGQTETFYSLSLAGNGSGSGALINSASGTVELYVPSIILTTNASIGGIGGLTLPGTLSGPGALTCASSATLELQGQNLYTGGTIVSSGTLDANVALSLPGNVTVDSGAILELDDPAAMSPTAALTLPASPAAGTVNLGFGGTQNIGALYLGGVAQAGGTWGAPGSGAANQSAIFTGSGILNVGGSYWDANGSDATGATNSLGGGSGSWDGVSTDWWAGGSANTIWAANNDAVFGGTPGTVTVNATESVSGLIFNTAGYTLTNTDGISSLNLVGEYPAIQIPAGTTTVACSLSGGGGNMGLTINGPGTLNLTGANTYTGDTTINSATVNVNAIADSGASSLANNGNLDLGTPGVASGATINFTGTSGTTARQVTLNGTTTSVLNVPGGSSLALNGQVKVGSDSAAQNLTKTGTGTLFLGGAGDNSSLAMAINQGEVIITKSSISSVHGLGGGTTIVGTGATGNSAELQLAGSGNYDLYSGCKVTVNSPDGFVDLNGQSDAMSTLTLSGAGPAGTGVLINSTNAATSTLTNGGSGVVLSGPSTIGGSGGITLASAISGTGPLTYAGNSVLTLISTSGSTYTGGTVVNPGGTVALVGAASAGGTGAITDSGTLDVNLIGNNFILANTITGTGVVNMVETSGDNLQLGGSMSGFTGVINCPTSPGSTAKAQILTTNVALNPAATINVAAGGTLYLANAGVTIPCPVYLYGTGNSETYGALRMERNATVSGPVILLGNTTMGNGVSGISSLATISGPISQSNGVYGITFTAEPGVMVLTGTNTYTGATTLSETSPGALVIGGSGTLGAGDYAAAITNDATFDYASSASQTLSGVITGTGTLEQSGPGLLTLTAPNTFTGSILVTNGATLAISGAGSLGAGGGTNYYTGSLSNYGVFSYAGTTAQNLGGTISGTGTLVEVGPGELILSEPNSYTGATTISPGATLALTSSGSINNTATVNLPAGATFDLSAFGLSYTIGSGTTLKAGGTGTGVGTNAAAIVGSGGGTINVGSLVLNYTPQMFTGDTGHPALYVPSGALNLSGSSLTVTNAAATPLGAGTYTLIQVAGQSLNVAGTNVIVAGTGLAAGATAALAVNGGNLNLVVTSTSVPVPAINAITVSGANVIFSGTNGSAGSGFTILSSTNLTLPLGQWSTAGTGSFSGSGTFAVTNAIGAGNQFFIIRTP